MEQYKHVSKDARGSTTHMVWLHLAVSVKCLNEPFDIRLELLIDIITVLLVQHLRQLVPKVEGNLSHL